MRTSRGEASGQRSAGPLKEKGVAANQFSDRVGLLSQRKSIAPHGMHNWKHSNPALGLDVTADRQAWDTDQVRGPGS